MPALVPPGGWGSRKEAAVGHADATHMMLIHSDCPLGGHLISKTYPIPSTPDLSTQTHIPTTPIPAMGYFILPTAQLHVLDRFLTLPSHYFPPPALPCWAQSTISHLGLYWSRLTGMLAHVQSVVNMAARGSTFKHQRDLATHKLTSS